MDYKKKYREAQKWIESIYSELSHEQQMEAEAFFPELKESKDERIRKEIIAFIKKRDRSGCDYDYDQWIAWLEKQGSEPNWCHHKVDLSNCSEEYRKAYYDGWNNCNQQHSQCKSEWNDVVKCLINGMKFYYEDNEEATWGTEKFSMKVKDILSWLEKQGEQKAVDSSQTCKMETLMTLDKAIEHCKEKSCDDTACGKEHKQLAEWLTELKGYRGSVTQEAHKPADKVEPK